MNSKTQKEVVISTPNDTTQSHVTIAPPISSHGENNEVQAKNVSVIFKVIKSAINFFFDFLETIVVALSIFVVVYLFILQPHEVKGNSMEPSFQNNEYIITDKISYRFKEPHRGDVIIFKAPVNPDVDYIKRIIALPGEQVMVQNGEVYVNNTRLIESYIDTLTPLFPGSTMQESTPITVPEGDYFVMGDNRSHSSDSREFGPIDKKLIIGRAVFRYWPLNSIGAIPEANYNF